MSRNPLCRSMPTLSNLITTKNCPDLSISIIFFINCFIISRLSWVFSISLVLISDQKLNVLRNFFKFSKQRIQDFLDGIWNSKKYFWHLKYVLIEIHTDFKVETFYHSNTLSGGSGSFYAKCFKRCKKPNNPVWLKFDWE